MNDTKANCYLRKVFIFYEHWCGYNNVYECKYCGGKYYKRNAIEHLKRHEKILPGIFK